MNFQLRYLGFFLVLILTIVGCNSTDTGSPVVPVDEEPPGINLTAESEYQAENQAWLWGYFDIYLDTETKSIEIVPNRTPSFTVNIVNFLNNDPLGLAISFNGTTVGTGFIDVDMDITISHPLDDEQFDGYDVRGIFLGEGSGMMDYENDLLYAVQGAEQILLNADGYTRWFNPAEFAGDSIFGSPPGNLAPIYDPTATLNPYKYFGEGLGVTDNLWDYLTSGGDNVGYFLHGTGNTRNYVIRFPIPSPGIKYAYAVTANWEGAAPEFHPSHALEAVGVTVTDNSTMYYVDETNNGGDLILDISVFDWDAELTGGVMEDYYIKVESTVKTGHHNLNSAEMTPVASGDHWHTYHVEIPADDITGLEGNEMWVIIEDSYADYTNPFGIPNDADTDPIAACFRFDLAVAGESPSWIQVTSPNGGEEWKAGSSEDITWSSVNMEGDVGINYTISDGDPVTVAEQTENDGSYIWDPIPDIDSDEVKITVFSIDEPNISDESDDYFFIASNPCNPDLDAPDTEVDCPGDQPFGTTIVGIYVGDSSDPYDCTPQSELEFSYRKNHNDIGFDEWSDWSTAQDGYIYLLGLTEGNWEIEIKARDNANNVDSTPEPCSFTIIDPCNPDNDPPDTIIWNTADSPDEGQTWHENSAIFTFYGADPNSCTSSQDMCFHVILDGPPGFTDIDETIDNDEWQVSFLINGDYHLEVSAIDLSDNEDLSPAERDFSVDFDPCQDDIDAPTLLPTPPESSIDEGETVNISWTVTDNCYSSGEVVVKVFEQAPGAPDFTMVHSQFSNGSWQSNSLSAGEWHYYLEASDLKNNISHEPSGSPDYWVVEVNQHGDYLLIDSSDALGGFMDSMGWSYTKVSEIPPSIDKNEYPMVVLYSASNWNISDYAIPNETLKTYLNSGGGLLVFGTQTFLLMINHEFIANDIEPWIGFNEIYHDTSTWITCAFHHPYFGGYGYCEECQPLGTHLPCWDPDNPGGYYNIGKKGNGDSFCVDAEPPGYITNAKIMLAYNACNQSEAASTINEYNNGRVVFTGFLPDVITWPDIWHYFEKAGEWVRHEHDTKCGDDPNVGCVLDDGDSEQNPKFLLLDETETGSVCLAEDSADYWAYSSSIPVTGTWQLHNTSDSTLDFFFGTYKYNVFTQKDVVFNVPAGGYATLPDPQITLDPNQYMVKIYSDVSHTQTYEITNNMSGNPGDNHIPICNIQTDPDPAEGPVPLTVHFDGTGSYDNDPGDFITSYEWNFGDGSPHEFGPTSDHTYTSPMYTTATLTVTDSHGAQNACSAPIHSYQGEWNIEVEAINQTFSYQYGDDIPFKITVTYAGEPQSGITLGCVDPYRQLCSAPIGPTNQNGEANYISLYWEENATFGRLIYEYWFQNPTNPDQMIENSYTVLVEKPIEMADATYNLSVPSQNVWFGNNPYYELTYIDYITALTPGAINSQFLIIGQSEEAVNFLNGLGMFTDEWYQTWIYDISQSPKNYFLVGVVAGGGATCLYTGGAGCAIALKASVIIAEGLVLDAFMAFVPTLINNLENNQQISHEDALIYHSIFNSAELVVAFYKFDSTKSGTAAMAAIEDVADLIDFMDHGGQLLNSIETMVDYQNHTTSFTSDPDPVTGEVFMVQFIEKVD